MATARDTLLKNVALGIVSGLAASLAMNLFQSGWSAAQARLMGSGCTCFRMASASIVVSSGSHWSSRP